MAVLFLGCLVSSPAVGRPPDPPSRFATLDGARIHYRVHGRGRTAIVLVHGWACDMTVWRDAIPRLAQKATVITLDLPGHGKSDAPKLDYTLRHFARAVRAVMDDARVQRAILVGHGMGTPVIRQVDRLFPTRVRALIAVDGTLKRPTAAPAGCGASTPLPPHVNALEHFGDDEYWKDDQISVPLLVINATGDDEPYVRALGTDIDYQVMERAMERADEFHARVEAWLIKKGYWK